MMSSLICSQEGERADALGSPAGLLANKSKHAAHSSDCLNDTYDRACTANFKESLTRFTRLRVREIYMCKWNTHRFSPSWQRCCAGCPWVPQPILMSAPLPFGTAKR